MSLIASAKSNDFEICPEGVHGARCNRIIDLGTQSWDYLGKPKTGRKIWIFWEAPEVLNKEGKPFTIAKKYTLSLSEKAALRLDLQSWRGRKFTPEELEGFDIAKLLKAPCLLNIVHDVQPDKTYANISSIMPLPGSMTVPQLSAAPLLFSLSAFNADVYNTLSDGLKKSIASSPEYAEATGAAPAPSAGRSDIQDDDIPF
jgi:hypothetical protein